MTFFVQLSRFHPDDVQDHGNIGPKFQQDQGVPGAAGPGRSCGQEVGVDDAEETRQDWSGHQAKTDGGGRGGFLLQPVVGCQTNL